MKKKLKLAFDELEKEMQSLTDSRDLSRISGGIQRDSSGNIIYLPISGHIESWADGYGAWAYMEAGYIYADNGDPILVYRNAGGTSGFDTDCHGVSFGDGQYWINNNQADNILDGDNYYNVPSGSYASGDIVVYYDNSGRIIHSATLLHSGSVLTTVYGQGGTQIENTASSIESGFFGAASYKVFRK